VASVDFKSRFVWLLKTFLIMGFIVLAAYGIVVVAQSVMTNAKIVTCETNLRRIGEALFLYKNQHNNSLPPYLTALYPDFIDEKEIFQCPADPYKGEKGAFPRWTRFREDGTPQPDWREEFGYADLDGPTLIPWEHTDKNGNHKDADRDTFPCSYYFRFNDYPADLENLVDGLTWRQDMEKLARKYGNKTPIVSCLWHLPKYAKDSDGVTTNLLHNLVDTARYPKDWRLIMRSKKGSQ